MRWRVSRCILDNVVAMIIALLLAYQTTGMCGYSEKPAGYRKWASEAASLYTKHRLFLKEVKQPEASKAPGFLVWNTQSCTECRPHECIVVLRFPPIDSGTPEVAKQLPISSSLENIH